MKIITPFYLCLFLAAIFILAVGCSMKKSGSEQKRLLRMKNSSNFIDGKFRNPIPYQSESLYDITVKYITHKTQELEPITALPTQKYQGKTLQDDSGGLKFTWLGHAGVLLEIEGQTFLTDPVFSQRVSPVQWLGPKRFQPAAVMVQDLPEIDGVIISHNHYDHLDEDSIKALNHKTKQFLVPLGVGAHLEDWGIPSHKIVELDWWESIQVGATEIVSTPALHFSGRGLIRNKTLWSSWVIKQGEHSVYFSGDTGMFPGFKEIGDKYGPFDVTLMAIGAYDPLWKDAHLNPEEAIQAHKDLKGDLFLPIHWGTFNLALHSWYELAERLYQTAQREKVSTAFPILGQQVVYPMSASSSPWWRQLTVAVNTTISSLDLQRN